MYRALYVVTLLSAACLCLLTPVALFADAPTLAHSEVPAGQLLEDASNGIYGETLTWPKGLLTALVEVEPETSVVLSGFPMAPGERLRVQLTRHEVYAPGALVHVVDGTSRQTLPRSTRVLFRGHSLDAPDLRFALSLDADASGLRGTIPGPDGRLYVLSDSLGVPRLEQIQVLEDRLGVTPTAHCDAGLLPRPDLPPSPSIPKQTATTELGAPTWGAVVAVDTDNEFNHLKFGNDTSAATDYIADLFNEMNIMYERDLDLRLLIGDTFLRLDTDNPPTYDDDPFNNTDSPASSNTLNEFGTHWQNNMSSVDRVFAMLLSGKSSSSNSASGIAWVDGYCENQNTGGGYSINQIFRNNSLPIINDARLVGHELGHNHGSPHTHCYNPPVDMCSTIEAPFGCYDGPVSCPAAGPGTVMSYCNFSESSCGQNRLEFHPTVMSNIDGFINNHTPTCVEPLTDPANIFIDGFESGNSATWDDTVP